MWSHRSPPVSRNDAGSSQSSSIDGTDLPEEQRRAQIGLALRDDQLDRAIALVEAMVVGPAKDEECERVFAFCIKKPALDRAAVVANACWDGAQRQRALQEIAVARLKLP